MSRLQRRVSRNGFTVIELLVVVGVIAILVALLLIAVQRSRESANRTECQNNLRQLALAVQQYESAYHQYPAGAVKYRTYDAAGNVLTYDRYTWCLLVLPYMEQNSLYSQWAFGYNGPPGNVGVRRGQTMTLPDTGDVATSAVAAHPVKTFICPSDPAPVATTVPYGVVTILADNASPLGNEATWSPTTGYQPLPAGDPGYWQWGITSYEGNGGTAVFGVLKLYSGSVKNSQGNSSDQNDSRDGTMYLWQHFDDPTGNDFVDLRYTVDAGDVTDGTSNTVLIGERYLYDPGFVANCYQDQKLNMVGYPWWANPNGQAVFAGTEFALNSSFTQLEAMMPTGCSQAGDPVSCACQARTANFGSSHSGGVNFAFCDGSVHFVSNNIPLATLQALATRAGGEITQGSWY